MARMDLDFLKVKYERGIPTKIKKIFKDFNKYSTIIIDSREQEIKHITDGFESMKYDYIVEKLPLADFSIKFLGENLGMYVVVERKVKNELVGNYIESVVNNDGKKQATERFKNELYSLVNNSIDCHIVVEDGSYKDLYRGQYNSQISSNSIKGLIHGTYKTFNCPIVFLNDKTIFHEYIINHLKYWVRSLLIYKQTDEQLLYLQYELIEKVRNVELK